MPCITSSACMINDHDEQVLDKKKWKQYEKYMHTEPAETGRKAKNESFSQLYTRISLLDDSSKGNIYKNTELDEYSSS